MTVSRLEEEMSASEMLEWIEYYKDEPAQMCPVFGGGGGASGDDGQSPEQQESILRMMAER